MIEIRRRGRPARFLLLGLPVTADPVFLLITAIAVTLIGLSKGGFFGLGVMGLPLMSLYVPPLQAAAILLPIVMAQDVLTIWTYRRTWSAWNLKVMLPGMAAGIAIGALFAASLGAAHIRLAIGLIAAAFVLRHWLGERFERLRFTPNAFTGGLFGAIGGFTTLLANAGGPAWQIHLLPQGLDKFTYAGTLTLLFALSNVMKVPALGVARPVDGRESDVRRVPVAARDRGELCGSLARAPHLDRAVLPHRLCADACHRDRADPQLARRTMVALNVLVTRAAYSVTLSPCGRWYRESGACGRHCRLVGRRPAMQKTGWRGPSAKSYIRAAGPTELPK